MFIIADCCGSRSSEPALEDENKYLFSFVDQVTGLWQQTREADFWRVSHQKIINWDTFTCHRWSMIHILRALHNYPYINHTIWLKRDWLCPLKNLFGMIFFWLIYGLNVFLKYLARKYSRPRFSFSTIATKNCKWKYFSRNDKCIFTEQFLLIFPSSIASWYKLHYSASLGFWITSLHVWLGAWKIGFFVFVDFFHKIWQNFANNTNGMLLRYNKILLQKSYEKKCRTKSANISWGTSSSGNSTLLSLSCVFE